MSEAGYLDLALKAGLHAGFKSTVYYGVATIILITLMGGCSTPTTAPPDARQAAPATETPEVAQPEQPEQPGQLEQPEQPETAATEQLAPAETTESLETPELPETIETPEVVEGLQSEDAQPESAQPEAPEATETFQPEPREAESSELVEPTLRPAAAEQQPAVVSEQAGDELLEAAAEEAPEIIEPVLPEVAQVEAEAEPEVAQAVEITSPESAAPVEAEPLSIQQPAPTVPDTAPEQSNEAISRPRRESIASARTQSSQDSADFSSLPSGPPPARGRPSIASIVSVVGEPFQVTLTGPTWLYIGEETPGGAVTFLRRTIEPTRSVFLLRIDRIGEYRLLFQNQDLVSDTIETHPVAIRVIEQEDAAQSEDTARSAVQSEVLPLNEPIGTADQQGEQPTDRRIEQGLATDQQGEQIAALIEDPQARDQLASRALADERYEEAIAYWSDNLSSEEPYAANARRGLTEAALNSGDLDLALTNVRTMLANQELPTADALHILAEERAMRGDNPAAIELFELLVANFPSDSGIDRAYFQLGRIYESDAELRNLRRALDYYRLIVDQYPISDYWEQASVRSEFLRRHFFDIR